MSKLSKLLQVTEAEKQEIMRHYNISEEEFEENVRIIKEWLRKNPHLPQENDDNKIKMALLNSKMSLEKTKKSLEGYYRVRRSYSDFFGKLVPNTKDYIKSKRLVQSVVIPQLGPDLCRITIFKVRDTNGEADDALIYQIVTTMIGEIRFFNDFFLSNIIIIDMAEYNLKNMLKYTPSVNMKLADIIMAINLRIKEIHIINTPSFIERVMAMVKLLLPQKLLAKNHFHQTHETLSDFIPKEYLPSNYGGTQKSIETLYDDWCSELESMDHFFHDLLSVKSTEDAQKNTNNEMIGMGFDGSFKKLIVD